MMDHDASDGLAPGKSALDFAYSISKDGFGLAQKMMLFSFPADSIVLILGQVVFSIRNA